jgi:general secretion pathway protein G
VRVQVSFEETAMARLRVLTEIAVVVSVLGAVASVASRVDVFPRHTASREGRARADIDALTMGIQLYKLDMGVFPRSLDDLTRAPADLTRWRGPYVEGSFQDPWGNDYVYTPPGQYSITTDWRSHAGGLDGATHSDAAWKLATAFATLAFLGQTLLLRRRAALLSLS